MKISTLSACFALLISGHFAIAGSYAQRSRESAKREAKLDDVREKKFIQASNQSLISGMGIYADFKGDHVRRETIDCRDNWDSRKRIDISRPTLVNLDHCDFDTTRSEACHMQTYNERSIETDKYGQILWCVGTNNIKKRYLIKNKRVRLFPEVIDDNTNSYSGAYSTCGLLLGLGCAY